MGGWEGRKERHTTTVCGHASCSHEIVLLDPPALDALLCHDIACCEEYLARRQQDVSSAIAHPVSNCPVSSPGVQIRCSMTPRLVYRSISARNSTCAQSAPVSRSVIIGGEEFV